MRNDPHVNGSGERRPVFAPVANGRADAEAALIRNKLKLHRRIIDELDLAALENAEESELRKAVSQLVRTFAHEEHLALNFLETEHLTNDIINEMLGLGPIEPLLRDTTINDILINTHKQVYVERNGVLELTPVRF